MRFEKVSLKQYLKDAEGDIIQEGGYNPNPIGLREDLVEAYENLKLPKRATKKSAGYDFFSPYSFNLRPGETIRIATGIRVILDDDKFLMCAPRSGHGFKARIQLDNTIGIIDADYADSENEGHIMLKLTNDSHTDKSIEVKAGEGIIQSIILQYFTVENDDTKEVRNGGFGSTTKKEGK